MHTIECGQLILRKITKIGAASLQMSDFKAKMHQIRFPRGARAYSAPSDSLVVFKENTSKGRVGRGKEGDDRGGPGGVAPNWESGSASDCNRIQGV